MRTWSVRGMRLVTDQLPYSRIRIVRLVSQIAELPEQRGRRQLLEFGQDRHSLRVSQGSESLLECLAALHLKRGETLSQSLLDIWPFAREAVKILHGSDLTCRRHAVAGGNDFVHGRLEQPRIERFELRAGRLCLRRSDCCARLSETAKRSTSGRDRSRQTDFQESAARPSR